MNNKPQSLILLGCNGNAWDVIETINALNKNEKIYEILGYLDDDTEKVGKSYLGFPVLGPLTDASRKYHSSLFSFCIGSTGNYINRHEILSSLGIAIEKFPTIVHPLTSVSNTARLGHGVFISCFSSVGPYVSLGEFCILLSHCLVSHESSIGDFTILTGGAKLAGRVTIGRNCYLGGGCLVRNDISICDGALVGLGAVVCKNVPRENVYVGNPAHPLRSVQISSMKRERQA